MDDLIIQIVKDPNLTYKETLASLYFLSILALYSGFYFYALAKKESQKDDLPTISYDD
jgi:hypothetical protein